MCVVIYLYGKVNKSDQFYGQSSMVDAQTLRRSDAQTLCDALCAFLRA